MEEDLIGAMYREYNQEAKEAFIQFLFDLVDAGEQENTELEPHELRWVVDHIRELGKVNITGVAFSEESPVAVPELKFKIGDKVKIVAAPDFFSHLVGKNGVIDHIHQHNNHFGLNNVVVENKPYNFYGCELEAYVEPKKYFPQIGDRVIMDCEGTGIPHYHGRHGIVAELPNYWGWVKIIFQDGDEVLAVPTEEFRRLKLSEFTADDVQVGDVLDFGGELWVVDRNVPNDEPSTDLTRCYYPGWHCHQKPGSKPTGIILHSDGWKVVDTLQ